MMHRLRMLLFAVGSLAPRAIAAENACELAAKALQAHDLNGAGAAVQECLTLRSRLPAARSLAAEIHSQIGLEYASQNAFGKAVEHFRAVTELQPGFAVGHYNLGLALLNLGDAAGAEKSFRQSVKLAPGNAKAAAQLARAVLSEARDDRTKMADAAACYRGAIQLTPADPELHFNLAYALAATHDEAGARAQYAEVLRLDPRYPDAEAALAYTLYRLSEWSEAEKHFRVAMYQGYNDYPVNYHLGASLVKMGKTGEAREYLEKAATLDPGQPAPHFQLARLYRGSGENDRAAAELLTFRELSTKQEANWRFEALQQVAQQALVRGDTSQGIDALTQAYQANLTAEGARNLGLAYLQSGDLMQSANWLERALAAAPRDGPTYNYLGLLEAKQGRLAAARSHFETALRIDSSNAEAAYNAGLTALELGDVAGAITHLQNALRLTNEPRVHEGLAVALSEAGRHMEAQKHFDAAQQGNAAVP